MKKHLKKMGSLVMTGLLSAGLLSGCGNTDNLEQQVSTLQGQVDTLQQNLDIVIQDMLTLEEQIIKLNNGEAIDIAPSQGQADASDSQAAAQKDDNRQDSDRQEGSLLENEPKETDRKESEQKESEPKESDQKETSDQHGSDKKDEAESGKNTADLLQEGKYASVHGALAVKDGKLVDANEDNIQLYGVSTHGLSWFPDYVNQDSFKTLRDDWGATCVRLAMYTAEYAGYCTGGDQTKLKNLVCSGVDAATDLGMYVIVDWHVLNDNDPTVYQSEAISFFDEMSKKYADNTNVIYEICNEPCNGCSWDHIYQYANAVIPVIRGNDSDAVILVGTPNWSQQIDKAAEKPLDFDNIMYTMHFYAATHQQDMRNTLESYAKNGLPVFVSEFGMCDASGNGGNDLKQAQNWIDLMDSLQISYVSWNLSNKNETSALISSSCSKTSGWSENDLSASGKWIRTLYRAKSCNQ